MVCLCCMRLMQNSRSHASIGIAMIQNKSDIKRSPDEPGEAVSADTANAMIRMMIAASAVNAMIRRVFFFIGSPYLSVSFE